MLLPLAFRCASLPARLFPGMPSCVPTRPVGTTGLSAARSSPPGTKWAHPCPICAGTVPSLGAARFPTCSYALPPTRPAVSTLVPLFHPPARAGDALGSRPACQASSVCVFVCLFVCLFSRSSSSRSRSAGALPSASPASRPRRSADPCMRRGDCSACVRACETPFGDRPQARMR